MDIKEAKKGEKLITKGEKVNRMYVVYRGSIRQDWKGQVLHLGAGTVVGLSDSLNRVYDSDYTVEEDAQLFECKYTGVDSFSKIFAEQPVYIFGFSKGSFRQCRDVFVLYEDFIDKMIRFHEFTHDMTDRYLEICQDIGCTPATLEMVDEIEPLMLEGELSQWEMDYISCLNSVDNKEIENIYGKREEIVVGVIGISCGYMQRAMNCLEEIQIYLKECSKVFLSKEGCDILELYYEALKFAAARGESIVDLDMALEEIENYITGEAKDIFDQKLAKERFKKIREIDFEAIQNEYAQAEELAEAQFDDTFTYICQFGNLAEETIVKKRANLDAFLAVGDKEGKDDSVRRARKKVVDDFYEIYEAVFFNTLEQENIPDIVKMFLHFGFLDVDAVGKENAYELKALVNKLESLCMSDTVYTIYTWLLTVYEGKREPSKNEMDLDYRGFIMEEKKAGNLTDGQVAEKLRDQEEKVKFEIHNFFKSSNRTTSGKMTSFSPVLLKEHLVAELDKMLVTTDRLMESMAKVEEVDYAIFYREEYLVDTALNIKSEPYMKRIQPDIILLPNVGMRAMLWQECGGIKTSTPGRMVFPMFTLDDLDRLMNYCCGSFRWEICRKEQGSRWNDVTGDSLTAAFYDYFTFYRKNKDISAENKEKIKNLLKSSRNNMREAFTKQYIIWINYEAQGSVRLNKVERNIFAKYCMFSKKYRSGLSEHPMFEQAISKHSIKNQQTLNHIKAIIDRYEKAGAEVPEDLLSGMEFLNL